MVKFIVASLLCLVSVASARPNTDRLDCLLTGKELNREECTARGCIWQPSSMERTPWCFLDTNKMGYDLAGETKADDSGFHADLRVVDGSEKQTKLKPIPDLHTEVIYLTKSILRFKVTDPKSKRYEVPIQHTDFNIPKPIGPNAEHEYKVELNGRFNMTVTRPSNGEVLFDTSIGGLIYSDNFLQIATKLASPSVYGIGENTHASFKHDLFYRTYPLFARDRPMGDHERNHYGTHPFFMVMERDGKAHGIFLLNSNAMAFTTMPMPGMSIKAMGGILDFFIILGDNPEDVLKKYQSIIGFPVMPPFWGMGFQLCRYGYKNLDHVKRVLERNINAGIPVDVQYLDIDYLREQRDFTYEKAKFDGLPEYIRKTQKDKNLRWTLILDPAIEGDKKDYSTFTSGYEKDVYIKWPKSVPDANRSHPANAPSDKDVMYGHVWPPGPAAFPDFFKNVTRQWWKTRLSELHKVLNYDAIWIDMNEPANFPSEYLVCPADPLDIALPSQSFPDKFSQQTICMSAVQGENNEYRHYDVHNLYGWSETKPTFEAVREIIGKRGYVVTRSTYPSSGKFAAHWLGDNSANWDQLRHSIIAMMEFSMFGISYTGADICGFIGEATADLCKRWFQLGAFYPFSRAHNAIDIVDQDPAWWKENGHPEVTEAAAEALRIRYQILHYMYTAMFSSHTFGDTVIRPMHHVFHNDFLARDIDQQFFIGPSLLVTPFVHQEQTFLSAYLNHEARWFLWSKSNEMFEHIQLISDHYELHDNYSSSPLFILGGSILPIVSQKEFKTPLTTANLREAPIELWVAPDSNGQAKGHLFYDDGEEIRSIENGNYNLLAFTLDNCTLTIAKVHGISTVYPTLALSKIKIALTKPLSANSTPHLAEHSIPSTKIEAKYSDKTITIEFEPPKVLNKLEGLTKLHFDAHDLNCDSL